MVDAVLEHVRWRARPKTERRHEVALPSCHNVTKVQREVKKQRRVEDFSFVFSFQIPSGCAAFLGTSYVSGDAWHSHACVRCPLYSYSDSFLLLVVC